MLQHTVRRACATSLKRGRLCQRRLPTGQAHPHQCRLRSSGPAAVSDLGVWANVDPSSSIREHSDEAIGAAVEHGARSDAGPEGFLRTRTSTTLGREVARILRSNQDTLQPEIVDLMVGTGGCGDDDHGNVDAFALIAKAHGRAGRPHLTLDLCEAVLRRTGKPLVPASTRGLVLLLEALQPKVARHASSTVEDGVGAVGELLRSFEACGKEIPLAAYKAAVKAVGGHGRCSAALELARDARSKLGDSAEGLEELYTLVMKTCEEQQAPDEMRTVLREREEAGGSLAPDGYAYASTLTCFGKASRVSEALDLFGEMLERGHKPNRIAVNSMLAACAKDAPTFWRHAKAIFEGMEERWGVSANVYHYTSMVTCLLKAGQWGEGIAITDRMEADGITPNTRFLEHMMQATVGARQWVTAEAVFRAMTEKYGHAAVVTRQSTFHFIQSMVMQKKLRKVISYVARIQKVALKGPAPRGTMDVHLLKCFRSIPGVSSEALAGALMTMIEKGVKLHPDCYSIVISKANQDKNTELSETLYKMLTAGNGGPSLSAANAAIKGCQDIDSALAIVASLGEHGLVPDKFTYAGLLHCCSNAQGEGGERKGERATQVWEAMLGDGITPHGGMLAAYIMSLMRSGDWEQAVEVRERYRGDRLAPADKHVDKLDFVAREEAVVDGAMANGLVDNGQSLLALRYVEDVLKARSEEAAMAPDSPEQKHFIDEDNHTILAGIRACRLAGSCETAMGFLEMCEARWSQGPLAKDVAGAVVAGEAGAREWREMLVRTRESRRRLYDCLLALLDEKGAKWSDVRGVVEGGMKNGAVSLMKDQQGGLAADQGLDFHGWSPRSACCIVRCVLEDLTRDRDFLLSTGQYDLGRAVMAQGLREFGGVSERWHADSPDPRGRRREFADGAKPARFGEREYGKGRVRVEGRVGGWEKPEGGWAGEGSDDTQAFWWKAGKRLSLVVGKPRPPPSIRHAIEEFCTLGVTPPLRVRRDASNPGVLNIEPEDVDAWLQQGGTVVCL